MTGETNPELPLYRWALRTFAFIYLVIPALIALAIGFLFDFGKSVEPVFFEAMAAGVLPVLLVACIVQYAILFDRVISAGVSKEDRELVDYRHAGLTYIYGLIFVAGEGSALYALAAAEQSTFLVSATSIYTLILLYFLLGEVKALSRPPESFLPTALRRKGDDRLREVAKRHEALAADIRTTLAEREKPDDVQ